MMWTNIIIWNSTSAHTIIWKGAGKGGVVYHFMAQWPWIGAKQPYKKKEEFIIKARKWTAHNNDISGNKRRIYGNSDEGDDRFDDDDYGYEDDDDDDDNDGDDYSNIISLSFFHITSSIHCNH